MKSARIVILQPAIIAYRYPFFRLLWDHFDANVLVFGGDQSREVSVRSEQIKEPWARIVRNHWLAGRRILWQADTLSSAVNADVCILNLNPRILNNWLILIRRRFKGKKTILWGHYSSRAQRGSSNYIRNWQMRLGSGLAFYTETEAAVYRQAGGQLPVVGLGNSCVHKADCEAVEVDRGLFRRAPQFVFVGRMDRSKKVGLLIEAFHNLVTFYPEAHLVLVGGGEEKEALEAQASELVKSGQVEFMGWIWDPPKIADLYARSAFGILPSYIGLSVIQSLGNGVPLIYPENEIHSPEVEACQPGENSLTFSANSAESLCAAMRSGLEDLDDWVERRALIAKGVREHYTFEGMVERTIWLIQMVYDKS